MADLTVAVQFEESKAAAIVQVPAVVHGGGGEHGSSRASVERAARIQVFVPASQILHTAPYVRGTRTGRSLGSGAFAQGCVYVTCDAAMGKLQVVILEAAAAHSQGAENFTGAEVTKAVSAN